MKYIHLYALFLVLVLHTSCGQNQTNVSKDNTQSQTKNTVTSRVPNSMVRNIKQARNGDILVASWKGVFRYDARLNDKVGQGKSFTNITSTIKSPSFWDVLEDRKGNIWAATRDSGVYYYKGESAGQAGFQHFTTSQGLVSNTVFSICEDKAGNIWFGTGGGASRWDARLNDEVGQGKSFQNFTTKEGLSNNELTTVMEDKTGKIWFGSRGEPCFYDGKTFTVLKNNDGKAFNNVWSIIEDKKGSIWFGDNDGLWRYDGSNITKVSQRGASAIIEDKKGNIWTTGAVNPPGGSAWALSRYDQKSLYNKKPAVTEIMLINGPGALCGILEANDGSIWFGALGPESGVYHYDGKAITNFMNVAGKK